jgi:hypothetical protein
MAIPNGLMPFIYQQSMGSAFGSIPGVNRPQDAGMQQMSPLMPSQAPSMNRDTATGLAILANMGYSSTPQHAMSAIAQGVLQGDNLYRQMENQILARDRMRQQMMSSMADARYKRMLLEQQNQQYRQTRERQGAERKVREDWLATKDITPEMRQLLATDDSAWKAYAKDQLQPQANWSEPYEMRVGNTVAMVRRNEDTGEIKQIISGSLPTAAGGTGVAATSPSSPAGLLGLKEDDILDTNSARRMINDKGQNPPPGITVGRALGSGFRPASNDEIKRSGQAQLVRQHVQNLRNLALGGPGPDRIPNTEDDIKGIFTGLKSGLFDRAKGAATSVWNTITQNDPAWADYDSAAQAAIVPLIRSLGEVGNIALPERAAAMQLIPKAFPVPDSEDVAKRKLARLEAMLNEWLTRGQQYQQDVLAPMVGNSTPQEVDPNARNPNESVSSFYNPPQGQQTDLQSALEWMMKQ